MNASAEPQRTQSIVRWTRVMEGEYQGHSADTIFYVNYVTSGCPTCAHRHEGWQLAYSLHGRKYRHQFPSMRSAKVAAELAARALGAA